MKKILCFLFVLLLAASPALAEEGLADFTALDLDGNEVTREIFANYDLTVVNVWATWCPYCVEEMPFFAEYRDMLPENVNFLTICTDAGEEPELAAQILTEAGANFQTLAPDSQLYDQLTALVYAFPTTLFLDSEGKCAAEPLVGALRAENPAEALYQVTQGVLGMLEG